MCGVEYIMIEIYILPIAIVPGIGSAAGGVKVHAIKLHNYLFLFSPNTLPSDSYKLYVDS